MNKTLLTAKFMPARHWKQQLYSKFHFLLRLRVFENSLGLVLVLLFRAIHTSSKSKRFRLGWPGINSG